VAGPEGCGGGGEERMSCYGVLDYIAGTKSTSWTKVAMVVQFLIEKGERLI